MLQRDSDIAIDAAGNFVVTWMGEEYNGAGWGIYGRRFNSAGSALASEFHVNTSTSNDQITPAVAMDTQGNFVVTWASYVQGDNNVWDIYAPTLQLRRYGSRKQLPGQPNNDQQPDHSRRRNVDQQGICHHLVLVQLRTTRMTKTSVTTVSLPECTNSNGSDYVDTRIGTSPVGEFQVND